MGKWVVAAVMSLVLSVVGCAVQPKHTSVLHASTIFIVNGADGPGPWYNSLRDGLAKGNPDARVEMVNWGLPWMVWGNLSFSPLHTRAEGRLQHRIDKALKTGSRVTLVGHSAGCGVILRTLEKLPADAKVDEVLLLAACVSESYDLAKALPHVRQNLHVFHSEHDQMLLKFSTLITGTYEHAWSRAAGLNGFIRTSDLDAEARAKLQQHPYDPNWQKLGHSGGHFGYRSTEFAMNILAPLAAGDAPTIAAVPERTRKPIQ